MNESGLIYRIGVGLLWLLTCVLLGALVSGVAWAFAPLLRLPLPLSPPLIWVMTTLSALVVAVLMVLRGPPGHPVPRISPFVAASRALAEPEDPAALLAAVRGTLLRAGLNEAQVETILRDPRGDAVVRLVDQLNVSGQRLPESGRLELVGEITRLVSEILRPVGTPEPAGGAGGAEAAPRSPQPES
jgi:hypothetical protein